MSTTTAAPDSDGAVTLTSAAAGPLLDAAVRRTGDRLLAWKLNHVDANPGRSTTATYRVSVQGTHGARDEMVGVSIRTGGPSEADARVAIFSNGVLQAACWIHPNDPDLPGLPTATDPVKLAELLAAHRVMLAPPDALDIRLVSYRPRRRAVVRVRHRDTHHTVYVKVVRASDIEKIRLRHDILLAGGIPAPRVLAATDDHLLVFEALRGRPLARAIFDEMRPTTAEELVALLDRLPREVAHLERRAPWAASVKHYANVITAGLPSVRQRLTRLSQHLGSELGSVPLGDEPTHGDFYEAQVYVAGGHVTGLLDVDTVGPGRRADDLACLVAHLSCIQRMNAVQEAHVQGLVRDWLTVFDQRVPARELRLRAAAVTISLATGPFRAQEERWEKETDRMLGIAETFVGLAGA